MTTLARDAYLETQVLTATPQKLRLMLIEGAICQAQKTQVSWNAGRFEEAFDSLTRCRGILSELLGGIRPDEAPLTRQVAALYVFLLTTVSEAQLRRDGGKLSQVIAILQIERETWRQLCDQTSAAPPEAAGRQPPQEVSAADMAAILPASHGQVPGSSYTSRFASQFSLEG